MIGRKKETLLKNEVISAFTTFFTCSYIIIVNGILLHQAGMSLLWTIIATTLVCCISCILLGIYANVPLIIIPGIGETIFFTYTIIKSHYYNYHEALAIVLISGLIFTFIAYTPFARVLDKSIPKNLKEGITIGIGLFMAFVGLQNSKIIIPNRQSIVELNHINIYSGLAILLLLFAIVIFTLGTKLAFFYTVIIGIIISFLAGIIKVKYHFYNFSLRSIVSENNIFSYSFDKIGHFSFWSLVFSLTILLLFQNLGTLHGLKINDKVKLSRIFKMVGITNIISSLFGVSSTVIAVESSTATHSGAKTGKVSILVGIMFLLSLLIMPVIIAIPSLVVSPILIIVGGLMFTNIKELDFNDMTEFIPCYITIIMIPLTFDIATGMGFGFISYVLINFVCKKTERLNPILIIIALLFTINLVLQ